MGVPAWPGRTGHLVRSGHEGQRIDARAASGPHLMSLERIRRQAGDLLVGLYVGSTTARNESIGDRSLRPLVDEERGVHA
jgi:hypothetical protein